MTNYTTDVTTTAHFRDGAGCIHCGITLGQTQVLWDVFPALWCTECNVRNFTIQAARGIVCHQDMPHMPMATAETVLKVEANAKEIWNSLKAEKGASMNYTIHPECIYYPVYTKMWEFKDGTRVSTAHLTDGRFVLFSPRLPKLKEIAKGMSSRPSTHEAAVQTEWMVWYPKPRR